MDKVEIYKWLKSQKYPTGYDEVGEYLMYYSVDMPEILEDYYAYKVKKLNEPAVINNEASALSERVAVCCQTCKYVDGIRCNEVNGGCELDEYECWEQQTDL